MANDYADRVIKEWGDTGSRLGKEHAEQGVKTTPGKAFKSHYGTNTNDGTPKEFRDNYRKAYGSGHDMKKLGEGKPYGK
jgi:hypothetical protein